MNRSGIRCKHLWMYVWMAFLVGCNLPTARLITPTPFFPTPTFMHPPSPWPSSSLPTPTLQPAPISTAAQSALPTATSIPIPCNRAQFVGDVTIPDGIQVPAGTSFTKTWRLRNTGSCTWTPGYVLLFDHGDSMNAASGQPVLPGTVPPGGTVEVSIPLKAPSNPGSYQASFRLRSPDNLVFGIGNSGQDPFWVKIVVPQPTALQPNFDSIIRYMGGADGFSCNNGPSTQPAVEVQQFGNVLAICIWGLKLGTPINLNFSPPDGMPIQPILLQMDETSSNASWQGYGDPLFWYGMSDGDATEFAIHAWLPFYFPVGDWQVLVNGEFLPGSEFTIEKTGMSSFISAFNPAFASEFTPGFASSIESLGAHLIKGKINNKMDVLGSGFPPNTPVYVLVYHPEADFNYSLVGMQTITSDSNGAISGELNPVLNLGERYLLVAITDPNTHIMKDNGFFDTNLTYDFFDLISP